MFYFPKRISIWYHGFVNSSLNFQAERAAFRKLKQSVEDDPELKHELETAFRELLTRFATTIYENRFVVGGAIEVILLAALRASGIEARDVGAEETRIDIRIPTGGFSVKGHFSNSGDVRLINVLGDSEQTAWKEATLFVLYGIGIGYADPKLLEDQNAVRRTKDAIVIRYSVLRGFFSQNSEWLIQCEIPQALQNRNESELVSRTVAREILAKTPKLFNALPQTSF